MDPDANIFVISSISKCFYDRRCNLLDLLLNDNQSVQCLSSLEVGQFTLKRYFYRDRNILFMCLVPSCRDGRAVCTILTNRSKEEMIECLFDFIRAVTLCFIASNIVMFEIASLSIDYSVLNMLTSVNDLRVRFIEKIGECLNEAGTSSEDTILSDRDLLEMTKMYVPELLVVALRDGTIRKLATSSDNDAFELLETRKNSLHTLLSELFKQYKLSKNDGVEGASLFSFPYGGIYVCSSAASETDIDPTFCFDDIGCVPARDDHETPWSVSSTDNLSFGGTGEDDRRRWSRKKLFAGLIEFLSEFVEKSIQNHSSNTDDTSSTDFPTLSRWIRYCDNMHDIVTASSRSDNAPVAPLLDSLKKELREKEAGGLRIHELESLAMNIYTEGLPEIYTKTIHKRRLRKMVSCLDKLGLSDAVFLELVQRLTDRCDGIFVDRMACEYKSVLGYQCVLKAEHVSTKTKLEDSDHFDKSEAIKHDSGVFMLSASNCGRFQIRRPDPFTVKEANYDFYLEFHPKTDQLMLNFEFVCGNKTLPENNGLEPSTDSTNLQASDGSSQIESLVRDMVERIANLAISDVCNYPASEENGATESMSNDAARIPAEIYNDYSKQTSEMKDGMMHSARPNNFRPSYSSWNLCCIGRYSDYDVDEGLKQPGFIKSMNTLMSFYPKGFRTKLSKTLDNMEYDKEASSAEPFYVGCEYECGLGHRFIRRFQTNCGSQSEFGAAEEVDPTVYDMPLYVICPLRRLHVKEIGRKSNSSTLELNTKEFSRNASSVSQLMRVFTACPKSNQSKLCMSLKPQVTIPLSGEDDDRRWSPLFMPSYGRSIILEADALWVLRLPMVYVLNDEVLPRPTEYDLSNRNDVFATGKLLSSLFTPIAR